MRPSFAFLVLATTYLFLVMSSVVAEEDSCAATAEEDFDFEYSTDDGVYVYWTTPTVTISFKVLVEQESWLSIGFSEDGSMVDSDAVILKPDDGTVEEYMLTSKDTDGITLSTSTDISESSFSQVDGITTLEFTRNTVPSDEDSGKQTISSTSGTATNIIWAFGSDNTFEYHSDSGSFSVDLTCPNASSSFVSVSPTPSPTDADSNDARKTWGGVGYGAGAASLTVGACLGALWGLFP